MGDGEDLTLGARLDAAARRLIEARRPRFGWLGSAQPVLARTAQRQAAHGGRFDRAEADPRALALLPTAGRAGGFARPDRVPAGEQQWWVPATTPHGRAAPADVRRVLRDVAGPGADALRIHDDSPADTFARASAATAVAVGPDVSVAGGRVDEDPAAVALLAHEAVHVAAAADPAVAARRSTDGGMAAEEAAASTAEQRAWEQPRPTAGNVSDRPEHRSHRTAGRGLGAAEPAPTTTGYPPVPLLPLSLTVPTPAPATRAGAPPPAATPMHAAVDRPPAGPPPVDTEALRAGLMRDLLRQLRVEFERGG